MREQLDRNIKELMDQHPALGGVLEAAGIGCTTCSLGTCRVKDILEIHDLDTARTHALLQRMGEVIHGGAPFEVPVLERKASEPRASFCPPIARMVEEHVWIKRLLARIPDLLTALGRDWAGTAPQVERCLEFIRSYADRYHHAKEEDLLFAYFDRDSDILQAMCGDHAEGRDHVRNVAEARAVSDVARVEHHLRAYGELLAGAHPAGGHDPLSLDGSESEYPPSGRTLLGLSGGGAPLRDGPCRAGGLCARAGSGFSGLAHSGP